MKAVIIAVLWLSCVSSAMGVVYVSYESRQATQKLEVLRRESGRMQVASGQFLLEKSTWAAYSRVEKIAVNELNMVVPDSDKTVLVYKK
ncbi:cell division protein FtsL [Teredinibacter purpureus]|jgi:cell division protein FtsL|uniref:cell division protein FtsL n=1 Tax=Teredinibacter purpureus TaxID=2731756 RepID=UPI0005F7857C|nr:cell division protein FtsL [Teredinibacter purpureus]